MARKAKNNNSSDNESLEAKPMQMQEIEQDVYEEEAYDNIPESTKMNKKLQMEQVRLAKEMKRHRLQLERERRIQEEIEKRMHAMKVNHESVNVKEKSSKKKVKIVEESSSSSEEEVIVVKNKKKEVVKQFPAYQNPNLRQPTYLHM